MGAYCFTPARPTSVRGLRGITLCHFLLQLLHAFFTINYIINYNLVYVQGVRLQHILTPHAFTSIHINTIYS